jgi:ribosomal protein L37AE/L43A
VNVPKELIGEVAEPKGMRVASNAFAPVYPQNEAIDYAGLTTIIDDPKRPVLCASPEFVFCRFGENPTRAAAHKLARESMARGEIEEWKEVLQGTRHEREFGYIAATRKLDYGVHQVGDRVIVKLPTCDPAIVRETAERLADGSLEWCAADKLFKTTKGHAGLSIALLLNRLLKNLATVEATNVVLDAGDYIVPENFEATLIETRLAHPLTQVVETPIVEFSGPGRFDVKRFGGKQAAKSVVRAWPEVAGYRCRKCRSLVRESPDRAALWGCGECGYTADNEPARLALFSRDADGETANIGVPIAKWPSAGAFHCNTCGDNARVNPLDSREWGCARCNGSSHSVALNFTRDGAISDDPNRPLGDDVPEPEIN